MPVRTFRFLHPNDGTTAYQDNDPERNRVLWERIEELENIVERQGAHINDLNDRLQEYQGRVFYPIHNTN
jgi:hypothetical protein